MSLHPQRDQDAGITRCAVCDGYMRNFAMTGPRRITCADITCEGHATGGVMTDEMLAMALAKLQEGAPCR